MKKVFLFYIIVVCLPLYLFSQGNTPINSSDTIAKKYKAIDMILNKLNTIDKASFDLSVRIHNLKFPSKEKKNLISQLEPFNSLYDSVLKLKFNSLPDSNLFKSDSVIYKTKYQDFLEADSVLKQELNELKSLNLEYLHTSQLNYLQGLVMTFKNETNNFRQYIQSLKRNQPDDLWKKIEKEEEITHELIHDADLTNCTVLDTARNTSQKTDKIINLLTPDTSKTYCLIGSSFSDNVYSITFIPKKFLTKIVGVDNRIGFEFAIPIKSKFTQYPGGFIHCEVPYNKLLIETGVGFLKNSNVQQNFSWKCGLLFTPKQLGFGVSYSPLTNFCFQIAWSWRGKEKKCVTY